LLVSVGDPVKRDQGLVTVESDKATMEVPSPVDGVVKELKVKLGDTLSTGSVVAMIEPSELAARTDAFARRDTLVKEWWSASEEQKPVLAMQIMQFDESHTTTPPENASSEKQTVKSNDDSHENRPILWRVNTWLHWVGVAAILLGVVLLFVGFGELQSTSGLDWENWVGWFRWNTLLVVIGALVYSASIGSVYATIIRLLSRLLDSRLKRCGVLLLFVGVALLVLGVWQLANWDSYLYPDGQSWIRAVLWPNDDYIIEQLWMLLFGRYLIEGGVLAYGIGCVIPAVRLPSWLFDSRIKRCGFLVFLTGLALLLPGLKQLGDVAQVDWNSWLGALWRQSAYTPGSYHHGYFYANVDAYAHCWMIRWSTYLIAAGLLLWAYTFTFGPLVRWVMRGK
jgi:hypothetical protein